MKRIDAKTLLAIVVALLVAAALSQASPTDDRVEAAAKQSYVFKTYLKDDHIKIESKDGIVTLTGTVAEDSHKTLAEDTVASLPGVKTVESRLEVKQPGPLIKSDDWISAKVKAGLLFHRHVSARDTKVTVKGGVVTLRGEASSPAEKDLATEYTRDVEGVKDVVNEMSIREGKQPERTIGEKIDDASITAQVKMTLLTRRSTSAVNTKVETKDGIVTLTGKAQNAAERDLVTKIVTDINGVKTVNNQMTIESASIGG
jgi:hyperosmotically inducible periplasmic protein